MTRPDIAGSDWMRSVIRMDKNPQRREPSPLGVTVADLLGYLFHGIYHISSAVYRTDWTDPQMIAVVLPPGVTLASIDMNHLTKLVFLAHHVCLRVEVEPAGPRCLRLLFHQRKRGGDTSTRHPTLAEAVTLFNAFYEDLEVQPGPEDTVITCSTRSLP